nr:hypothetical protein [Tanacetum cinerariifolium]
MGLLLFLLYKYPSPHKVKGVGSHFSLSDGNDKVIKDITYSDDEDDVGTKADFNNLEISITKPESEVILSPSSSAQSKEHDDKTKKEAKGKSPVESVTSYRDLNAEFEDCSENNKADFNNLESCIPVSPIPTTKIHKVHPVSQIIGDPSSTTQTRSMTRAVKDQGGLSQMFVNDFNTCMFACFLSQEKPKRVHQALKDPS